MRGVNASSKKRALMSTMKSLLELSRVSVNGSTLLYLIPIFARTAALLVFSSHTFLQGLFRCRKIAKSVLMRT